MYNYYYLPDDGLMARRDRNKPQFEYYDTATSQWVPDWDLSGIFSDDIRSIYCESEAKAWSLLNSQK